MRRSEESELMDADGVSADALAHNYRELDKVHRWLGNTNRVLRLLKENPGPPKRVLDVGCGQGALLLHIRRNLGVEVIGFDLRPAPPDSKVLILAGNAVSDPLPEADAAVCVVMAHHLSEEELASMIGNVGRSCRRFVLLDLVRHPVPLVLFRAFLCPLLSSVNARDGQTSIRRAYTVPEMRNVVNGALFALNRPVSRLRHTVAPLWIRQVVDICWEPTA